VWDLTDLYVGRDSLACRTRRIHMLDMTCGRGGGQDSWTWGGSRVMSHMNKSHIMRIMHDMREDTREMTQFYGGHDLFEMCFWGISDNINRLTAHDSLICGILLIVVWDMTH